MSTSSRYTVLTLISSEINILSVLSNGKVKIVNTMTSRGRRGVASFYSCHFSVSRHCDVGAYLLSIAFHPKIDVLTAAECIQTNLIFCGSCPLIV